MDDLERLKKTIEILQLKIETITQENIELRKINKSLNSKLNLLINDTNIVKNVKQEMVDNSGFNFYNDDMLKEFFHLLVLCEKMKYMNYDKVWQMDASELYKEVQLVDIPFYNWHTHISIRLENTIKEIEKKNFRCSIIDKIK